MLKTALHMHYFSSLLLISFIVFPHNDAVKNEHHLYSKITNTHHRTLEKVLDRKSMSNNSYIDENNYLISKKITTHLQTLEGLFERNSTTNNNNVELSTTISPATIAPEKTNYSELLIDDDVVTIEEPKDGVDHSRPYGYDGLHYSMLELNLSVGLPIFTSFLSFLGSSTIIFMLLRRKKKYRLASTYDRIIFGMSLTNILSSIANMFWNLLSPAGIDYRFYQMRFQGYGTTATCTIQGYFYFSGIIGTTLYYCALSFYYVVVVTTRTSEQTLTKRIEPFLHAIPILFSFGSGIFLAIDGDFNPSSTGCWLVPYPVNCRKNLENCTRGQHAFSYRWIFAGIPIILVFFAILTFMTILVRSVRKQDRRMQRYRFVAKSDDPDTQRTGRSSLRFSIGRLSISKGDMSVDEVIAKKRKSSSEKVQKATTQALFYITAYFITFIFAIIFNLIYTLSGRKVIVFLYLLELTFAQAQGFLNFLVFIRPQIQKSFKNNPDTTLLRAFLEVIKSRGEDQNNTRRRRSSIRLPRRQRASSTPAEQSSQSYGGSESKGDSKNSSGGDSNSISWRRNKKRKEKPAERVPLVQRKASVMNSILQARKELESEGDIELSETGIGKMQYSPIPTMDEGITIARRRMSARSAALQAQKELIEEMGGLDFDDDYDSNQKDSWEATMLEPPQVQNNGFGFAKRELDIDSAIGQPRKKSNEEIGVLSFDNENEWHQEDDILTPTIEHIRRSSPSSEALQTQIDVLKKEIVEELKFDYDDMDENDVDEKNDIDENSDISEKPIDDDSSFRNTHYSENTNDDVLPTIESGLD